MAAQAQTTGTPGARGPLAGYRVIDLTSVVMGPLATQILGDMGADVIKVERPKVGDDSRHWGPPFTTTADGAPGDAAYFLCANRGKKSVALDIARPEGAEAVRRTLVGAGELGVRYLTLFGFSAENWRRPESEVSALMGTSTASRPW